MCKLVDEYIAARKEAARVCEEAQILVANAEVNASAAKVPTIVRGATHEDVVVGAVLWYPEWDADNNWSIVDEVLNPDSLWKAYVANDGCRYGLDGAFVEVT